MGPIDVSGSEILTPSLPCTLDASYLYRCPLYHVIIGYNSEAWIEASKKVQKDRRGTVGTVARIYKRDEMFWHTLRTWRRNEYKDAELVGCRVSTGFI